jgi:hypothetical protein
MKFKIIFLIHFFLTGNAHVFSQLQLTDVRDLGMGNSSIASSSPDGTPKNLALISNEKMTAFSCSVLCNYNIKDISPACLSFYTSIDGNLSLQASIGKLGSKSFSEEFIEAGIAKKLAANFSIGIKIQYHRWMLNDSYYENSQSLIPSIYLFASPLKNLGFGVFIQNPVRSRMNAIEQNKLPAKINTGISIRVSEKVQLAGSVNQQSNFPLSSQFGVEYIYHPKFILRFGWHTLPVSISFGFGLRFSKFNLDLAIQTHNELGNSSAIALTFKL